MTAIALLNPESDPHVVADTLLTADGRDPNPSCRIWLPALGDFSSQWGTDKNPWYITRLGRKTFFLPNNSGILAFATNHCPIAFDLWSELSAKFLNAVGYQPERKIDRGMVNLALQQVDSRKISLLGVLIDENGTRDAFVHNATAVLHTRNLGTCYIAGTGTQLVQQVIEEHDNVVQTSNTSRVMRRMTPTEDLAERISSQMLYVESDRDNGTTGSAIASGCGGFYEWYQVRAEGVPTLRARLDLNFIVGQDGPVVSRAYFSEQMERKVPPHTIVASQKYAVNVLNLGLEAMKPVRDADGPWTIHPLDCYGVTIESTFELYDNPGGTGRLSGPVSAEVLEQLFGEPVDVIRVRLVCSTAKGALARCVSRLKEEQQSLARISLTNGRLAIKLEHAIVATVEDMLERLK